MKQIVLLCFLFFLIGTFSLLVACQSEDIGPFIQHGDHRHPYEVKDYYGFSYYQVDKLSCSRDEHFVRHFSDGVRTCCPNTHIFNGYCCTEIQGGKCCNEAGNCCPTQRPLLDSFGKCHSCAENISIDVRGQELNCFICGETRRLTDDGQCILNR